MGGRTRATLQANPYADPSAKNQSHAQEYREADKQPPAQASLVKFQKRRQAQCRPEREDRPSRRINARNQED